jgi:hypothetical protein
VDISCISFVLNISSFEELPNEVASGKYMTHSIAAHLAKIIISSHEIILSDPNYEILLVDP